MDKIFKIGLLVLGIIFLVFSPFTSQKGRYSFHQYGGEYYVLDTATADLYLQVDEEKWKKINLKQRAKDNK